MINKNSPVPLYYQLEKIIKELIEDKKLKPGDPIPTEVEFIKKYAISRATVRKAITQLVNDGYLRRFKGKGTFVRSTPMKSQILGNLIGFSEEMNQRGVSHYSKVIKKCVIPASIKVADRLKLAAGDSVFYLKRLRFIEGEPILIVENYIPSHLCPEIEEENFKDSSLYSLIENKYNLTLHHGRREFEPINKSTKEEIELLNISPETPLMYVESLVFTENNTPVEYFEAKIRGKFKVDLISK